MTLLNDLRNAGLTVHPNPGWETATNNGRDRSETVGVMSHWDAISGWPGVNKYLRDNRFGGILYHIVIEAGGTLHLLSQRYVWHAGIGSGRILHVARHGGPVPDDAAGPDDTNGNPHFFGVCINYHPNDGPVPQSQYEALVTTNRVLAEHFGLNTGQVFRHMDWTTRKRDIDTISLATFRDDIGDDQMTELQARLEVASGVYARTGQWMVPVHGEGRQERLTRIAKEVAGGRPLADVLQHFGEPDTQPPSVIPAWVLSPFVLEGSGDFGLNVETVRVVKNVRLLGQ